MITRDYMKAWVLPEGAEYRREVYERQRAGGSKPLVDNPTVEEIRDALLVYQPRTVLEVGCGWGRILRPLSRYFVVAGCDVSREMLDRCGPLPVFQCDVTAPLSVDFWPRDCVFCRGVMMFLNSTQLAAAMRNMEAMARKKVLVWEWTDVCRQMQRVYPSDKFQYMPIEVKDE